MRSCRTHSQDWETSTQRVLNDAIVSIDVGQNLVVIKTVTGMAMGVATALDALKWPEILGCIAGDDTIMCACKSTELAEGVMEKLGGIFEQKIKRDDLAKRVWNVSAKINRAGISCSIVV